MNDDARWRLWKAQLLAMAEQTGKPAVLAEVERRLAGSEWAFKAGYGFGYADASGYVADMFEGHPTAGSVKP